MNDNKDITVSLTLAEVRVLANLVTNLFATAVDADLDTGVLESLYYKLNGFLDDRP